MARKTSKLRRYVEDLELGVRAADGLYMEAAATNSYLLFGLLAHRAEAGARY